MAFGINSRGSQSPVFPFESSNCFQDHGGDRLIRTRTWSGYEFGSKGDSSRLPTSEFGLILRGKLAASSSTDSGED